MLPNINPQTGIRYGVVALHSLAEWVYDEFFYHGRNITQEAIEQEAIATGDLDPEDEQAVQDFWDGYAVEEEEFELERDGLKLLLSYLGGAPLVWVCESPVTTHARPCSPCVPGAGNLDSLDPDGVECYTLPSEWFNTEA